MAGPSTAGLRTCLGCRERFERETLVRIVCDAEGRLAVDRHLKAPGRGAHLCYAAECVRQAVRRKAFGRAFRMNVQPVEAEALLGEITRAIDARVLDGLRIGRRAGWTRSGADVLTRERERLRLLLIAADTAPDSARRLSALGSPDRCPVFVFGDRRTLGGTQGQEDRVAIGVVDASYADRLQMELERRDRVLVAG
ncbi:MAG: DUF448 domain-containing protein [Myxococcales bacterium]|nr:DUF448 domain-containing protein [Myxococcales bacterium]